MELDLEQIAIILQRRHGWLRETLRLTDEMQIAMSRHDEISFSLLLKMRAEELAKYDASREELWQQAEQGLEAQMRLNELLHTDPDSVEFAALSDPMEKKIYEIRKKTKVLIKEIQEKEKGLRYRVTGKW